MDEKEAKLRAEMKRKARKYVLFLCTFISKLIEDEEDDDYWNKIDEWHDLFVRNQKVLDETFKYYRGIVRNLVKNDKKKFQGENTAGSSDVLIANPKNNSIIFTRKRNLEEEIDTQEEKPSPAGSSRSSIERRQERRRRRARVWSKEELKALELRALELRLRRQKDPKT